MTVTAIFLDGSSVSGATFHDVELALRADEWNPTGKQKFRAAMGERAFNWSGWVVEEEARSKAFLEQLEVAGVLRIEQTEGDER